MEIFNIMDNLDLLLKKKTNGENQVDDHFFDYYSWVYDLEHNNINNVNINSVFALANQCPATHGTVVFAARNLYDLLTNSITDFNDVCETGGLARSIKPKEAATLAKVNSIQLFPNPATNFIKIQGSNIKEITVLDITGKTYITQYCNSRNNNTVNIANLKAGFYIVKIVNANGSISTQKLIKQ